MNIGLILAVKTSRFEIGSGSRSIKLCCTSCPHDLPEDSASPSWHRDSAADCRPTELLNQTVTLLYAVTPVILLYRPVSAMYACEGTAVVSQTTWECRTITLRDVQCFSEVSQHVAHTFTALDVQDFGAAVRWLGALARNVALLHIFSYGMDA